MLTAGHLEDSEDLNKMDAVKEGSVKGRPLGWITTRSNVLFECSSQIYFYRTVSCLVMSGKHMTPTALSISTVTTLDTGLEAW